ncbi:PHB depolymerase family esterase [Paenibacillus sp. M-152]|uniref:PHB depolymerase family esterase n=1 Tax=Paenibacillus sp. M-152 TaxID=2487928 RepID=UPI000F7086B6|nr:PHB depolymerase family esterase [Paenibacillus sp. M-152]AZH29295.1 PdpB protein [Paenibacillus sp. M-152]
MRFTHLEKATTVLSDHPVRLASAYAVGPVELPENCGVGREWSSHFTQEEWNLEKACGEDGIELSAGGKAVCRLLTELDPRTSELNLGVFPPLAEHERLLLVSNLRCMTAQEVIFRPFEGTGQIWIDGTLVYAESGPFRLYLEEGDHTVVIIAAFIPDEARSIRISGNQVCDEPDVIELHREFVERNIRNHMAWLEVEQSAGREGEDSPILFYLLRKDRILLPSDQTLWVEVTNDEGMKLDQFPAHWEQEQSYAWDEEKIGNTGMLHFTVTYRDYEAVEHHFVYSVLVRPLSVVVEGLQEEYDQYMQANAKDVLHSAQKIQIKGLLEELNRLTDSPEDPFEIWDSQVVREYIKLLKQIFISGHTEQSQHPSLLQKEHIFLTADGIGESFFVSRLDNSLQRYTIQLPSNYTAERRYPLIVLMPGKRYELGLPDFQNRGFGRGWEDEAIFVTFSCRGVTLGSYIGEAAFLEGLDVILQAYRVDEERIYLTGYSNGAYAAWAMAQAYPSRFAAIAVISGTPHPKHLKNLINIPILDVCGDQDYLFAQAYTAPVTELSSNHFKGVIERQSNHWDTHELRLLDGILGWLMQWKRDVVPQRIAYRTERGRHNRAYWLELTRMDENEEYAELYGEMSSTGELDIEAVHAEEFVIHLSQEDMSLELAQVRIGARIFMLDLREYSRFRFVKTHSHKRPSPEYRLIAEREGESSEDSTKNADAAKSIAGLQSVGRNGASHGMGVLDVYMDRLHIVLPSSYTTSEEEQAVKRTANALASPRTATWNPYIGVHYPVVSSKDISEKELADSNVICITSGLSRHELLQKYQAHLQIACTEDGYTWGDDFTTGEYCLSYIQPSPWSATQQMLVVATNSPRLLGKNLFMRRLIMPGYFNGLHPYLNKEIIVYDSKGVRAFNFTSIKHAQHKLQGQ